MKGVVRINNYVDNRVMLSGRKVKNDIQAAVQTHRPRPLIVHHINYIEPQQNYVDQQTLKDQAELANGTKKRKRNKTVHINNNKNTQSKPLSRKNRVSVSLEHLRKGMTSAKKKSPSSSPSKDSDQIYLNETQKKMKVIEKNSFTPHVGLGKRCKSAIIKGHKSPEKQKIKSSEKQFFKKDRIIQEKDVRKGTKSSLNTSNKDKGKSKKSENRQKPNPSKQYKSSVQPSIKKANSIMNLQLNSAKKKVSKNVSTKVSARRTVSAKESKIISARENKKVNVKKRLFELGIDDESQIFKSRKEVEQINLSNLLAKHENDENVKKMISQLEIALNSIGSRKKLTKDLEIITESVKALAARQEFEEEEEEDSSYDRQQQIEILKKYEETMNEGKNQVLIEVIKSKQYEFKKKQKQEPIEKGEKGENDENDKNDKNDEKLESSESSSEEVEVIYDENQEGGEDELFNLEKQIENRKKREALHKELFAEVEDSQDKEVGQEKLSDEDKYELVQQEVEEDEQGLEEANPLLDRREQRGVEVDMNEYDSIKSLQDERDCEISQLKKFQQESDLMMRKVKKVKRRIEIDVEEKGEQSEKEGEQLEKEGEQSEKKNSEKTPINAEKYAFEKFPTPSPPQISMIRSPKYYEAEIVEALNLKGLILSDKHKKMGELVNTLYKKDIMSPKAYNIHLNSLQRKYEEENEVLDHHRKHAEELARLISDIKKEREEIHGIDELIRGQKWEEALGIMKKAEPEPKPVLPRQSPVCVQRENDCESDNSAPLYYEGEQSDLSEPGFRLIPISQNSNDEDSYNSNNEKAPQETLAEQNLYNEGIENNLITIDDKPHAIRAESPVQNRGFDSNLFFIKEYCISLCEFVRDNYKEEFKRNLSQPIEYDLDELLESYRTLTNGTPAQKVNSLYENLKYHECLLQQKCPPISEVVFDEFNQTYENIKFYGKKQTQDAALEGIFLRSIYNALNESINIERPGSLHGKALPWKHSSKHLKNMKNSRVEEKPKNQEEEDMIFGIAVARIIQWGSCLCGFIPDTVDLQNTQIDEEYINHIRETRMALLLEKMLCDEEVEMSKTELQETEVELQLSQVIYEEVVKEMASDLRKIQLKSQLRFGG